LLWRRVSRIVALLGGENVKKAIREVEEQLGKNFGNSKYWNIFLHGTSEEQRIAQEEIVRDMYGDDPQAKGDRNEHS